MPTLPKVQVGTGNETKIVDPVLLVGLNDSQELTPLKVSDDGKLMTQLPELLTTRLQVLGGDLTALAELDPILQDKELYIDDSDPAAPKIRVGNGVDPLGIVASSSGSSSSTSTINASNDLFDIAVTGVGNSLIGMIQIIRSLTANSTGAAWFAHVNGSGTITGTIRTSTGYARPVLADGLLGAQIGNGTAGTDHAISIAPGGTVGTIRALGFISVASGGSTVSGTITRITLSNTANRLVSAVVAGLTSMTHLTLSGQLLTHLDAGNLTALQDLQISSNRISYLNVNGCTALVTLNAATNRLTSWNTTTLPALVTLTLNSNRLETFEVGGAYSSLATLNLSTNQLTTLPTSGLSTVTNLNVSYNNFTELRGTGLTGVLTLTASYNSQLSAFYGSGLGAATAITVNNCALVSFDQTGLNSVVNLILTNNQLTENPITANIASLDGLALDENLLTSFSAPYLSNLLLLYLDDNPLEAFDDTGLTSVTTLLIGGPDCTITTFQTFGMPALQTLYYYSAHTLETLDLAPSSNLGSIYVEGADLITDISLADLPNVGSLRISDSGLVSADIAGNNLSWLDLSSNNLTTITGLDGIGQAAKGFVYSLAYNSLNATALNAVYTELRSSPTVGSTLTVTGNPGTSSDNPAIATGKGWIISG